MFLPPVAALLSAAGHFETAATLTGAGRVFAPKGPVIQSLDDASQAAMHAALGHRRYDELIDAGRRLTLEQATELAVSALTELAEPGNRLEP